MPADSPACTWSSSNQGSLVGTGNGGFVGSGANPEEELKKDKDEDKDGFSEEPDPTAPPIGIASSKPDCDESTYVECFYAQELFNIEGTMIIDEAQFNQLILAIFYDIHGRPVLVPFINVGYDTPFYDGGGEFSGSVCFQDGECYQRSEVNYIAQGMLAAAENHGVTEGEYFFVRSWKYVNHKARKAMPWLPGSYPSSKPSDGTLYWYRYGHNMYNTLYNSIDPYGTHTPSLP